MSEKVIRPARNVFGTLRVPGDKSISHRYAMLAGVAEGTSKFRNFSTGADCASTLECMRALGVECLRKGNDLEIRGLGSKLHKPEAPLDCGNSGSTMRMLAGIVAAQEFTTELRGDASLSRRPMSRIIAPLSAMGANFQAADQGRPPLRVTGGKLKGIHYDMPVPSAQVKSSLLFAGLLASGETSIHEPVRTRDHGELALRAFGAEVQLQPNSVKIAGGQQLHAIDADIPGDISSAAFFLCAAALFPGSQVVITKLGLNPTRSYLLDLLAAMGVRISITQLEEHNGELAGTVQVEGAELKGATIAGSQTARLIDEIPALAAIAPYTTDGIEIRDGRELRVKESDRIAAAAANLRHMGARVEELEDGLKIPGRQTLHGAEIDSCGDHRIAMAFAVAALRASSDTMISDAEAVAISYPQFLEALESIVQR